MTDINIDNSTRGSFTITKSDAETLYTSNLKTTDYKILLYIIANSDKMGMFRKTQKEISESLSIDRPYVCHSLKRLNTLSIIAKTKKIGLIQPYRISLGGNS